MGLKNVRGVKIMHITVINGSPKGQYSITLQTVLYLELLHPEHEFEYITAAKSIRKLEKDFTPAKEALERADLVLFSYPVYTFAAPSQLHRFIELMKESGTALAGKWVSQITTSKHFYDVTAHRYIEENCGDTGMNFVRGLSADMDDLTTEKGREEAAAFFEHLLWCREKGFAEKPKTYSAPVCHPASPAPACPDKKGDVVVVTDLMPEDGKLSAMIDRFCAVSDRNVRLINLRDVRLDGGCLGCLNCSVSGKCVYKDRFDDFLRESIQNSDAIVYAFTVKDHCMGSLMKTYDDRQFCNGHRTVTMGKPTAYLVSGNLSEETNLRMVIDGRSEAGGHFLTGVATDEGDTDAEIDRTAASLSYALDHHYTQPANFLGVGGIKIFRDLIYMMRGMMKADHKFYKQHGMYDFPQKKKGTTLAMYLVGGLFGNEKLRSKMDNKMNEGMLMPYKKVLDEVKKK